MMRGDTFKYKNPCNFLTITITVIVEFVQMLQQSSITIDKCVSY